MGRTGTVHILKLENNSQQASKQNRAYISERLISPTKTPPLNSEKRYAGIGSSAFADRKRRPVCNAVRPVMWMIKKRQERFGLIETVHETGFRIRSSLS